MSLLHLVARSPHVHPPSPTCRPHLPIACTYRRVNTFTPLLIRMNAEKTSRCGGVASAFSITYNTYICKRDTFYLIHAHSPRTTCTPTAEASEATEASEAIASRPFSTAKHVVEQAVQHCKALCSRLCSTACLVMFGRPCRPLHRCRLSADNCS